MNKQTIVSSVIISVALLVITLLLSQKWAESIKNQAIDGCIKNSITQYKNANDTGFYMNENWMKMCLAKKGYK